MERGKTGRFPLVSPFQKFSRPIVFIKFGNIVVQWGSCGANKVMTNAVSKIRPCCHSVSIPYTPIQVKRTPRVWNEKSNWYATVRSHASLNSGSALGYLPALVLMHHVPANAATINLSDMRKEKEENGKDWITWVDSIPQFVNMIEHGPKQSKTNRKAEPMEELNNIENPSSSVMILSNVDKRLFGLGFRESPSGFRVYDHIRKARRAF